MRLTQWPKVVRTTNREHDRVKRPYLQPYSTYKVSGVPWLRCIPDQWSFGRTKFLFKEKDQRSGEHESVLLSLTRQLGLVPQSVASNRIASVQNTSNYRVCRRGDLVMNRMQAWSGMFAVSSYDGVVSPDYSVFEAIVPMEVKFFESLFRTPSIVSQFAIRSKGIGEGFNRLYANNFGDVPVPIPPLSEQTAIVRYLERIDQLIKRSIRAKQNLLTLLEEQKKAIIHQAVTGQIDVQTGNPYPRYKPSGVEWLSDVPGHWSVVRLKRYAGIQGGYAFSTDDFVSVGIPVVRMQNIHRGMLKLSDAVRIPEHLCRSEYSLKDGDILYGLSGSIGNTGSLGNYAVVTDDDLPAQLNQRIGRFRPFENRLDKGFLVHCLCTNMFYEQVLSVTSGTAQFNVSTRDIGNVFLTLPTLPEQTAIARYLDKITIDIDIAHRCTLRQIELIEQFRIRLISDVVTGKLDVRDAVANSTIVEKSMDEIDNIHESKFSQ